MFGPHLMIDGSSCDIRKLGDRILVEQVMNAYPTAIGMTKIGGPYMFEYQAPDPAYSGISSIVVIAESHIAIHTFPELDFFTLDIFSCRNFDHEIAIEYIKTAFNAKEMDRLLVQRGLSFHGPRHGKMRALDGLITSSPDETYGFVQSRGEGFAGDSPPKPTERAVALLRQKQHQELQNQTDRRSAGTMLWPQYGVTPDYGSYGENATVLISHPAEPFEPDTLAVATSQAASIEPVQVNPTASISGLLDKMSSAGGQARALGRGLATWERMVRDREMTIMLALSTPVIAGGLREVLVYALDQQYIDTLILSAEDVFADLYESLGYSYSAASASQMDLEDLAPGPAGHQAALACFTEFIRSTELDSCTNSPDLWRRLGVYLPSQAPRKGVLQAAAAANIPLFTPDLGTSSFGGALLALRAHGVATNLRFDLVEEVMGLAKQLGAFPRLGIIRVGLGAADAVIAQAREVAVTLRETVPALCTSISLGTKRPFALGEQHVAIAAGAELVLPLLVTGLAQRVPYFSHRTS